MHAKPVLTLASVALASCIALGGCAAQTEGSAPGEYRQVEPAEAQSIMDSGEDVVILDVRTREEYDSGHIPGAICVPVESIGEEQPAELPDKDQAILVYCRSGNRSVQASEKLAAMGYSNVIEFGGINEWPGEVVK